jgi:hypothetical protein
MASAWDILIDLCSPNRTEAIEKHMEGLPVYTSGFRFGINYLLQPAHPEFILVAHYDRVPNVPGANDNGAAVACMIAAAHNAWTPQSKALVALTDLEEPANARPLKVAMAAGASHLHKTLQNANQSLPAIVLDVVGNGDTICLSRLSHRNEITEPLWNKFRGNHKFAHIPTPPSDNISFPNSILITLLPEDKLMDPHDIWSKLHTREDNLESVNPESMQIIQERLEEMMR